MSRLTVLFALLVACNGESASMSDVGEPGSSGPGPVGGTSGPGTTGDLATTDGTSTALAESSSAADDSTTAVLDMPPPQSECPRVRVVTPGEVLNVRPDPTTVNEPIGALPNNAVVEVLAEVEGEAVDGDTRWFHIVYLDTEGYVSAVFVECTLDDAPDLLPPKGYWLPLECGTQATVTQGNMGQLSHNGLHAYAFDFGLGVGTPLVAMADGIVTLLYAETVPGDPCYDGGGPECGPYGNLVILLHGDGSTSLYKHLSEVHVTVGEFVPQGLPVGLSGSTGYSTGRHAHVMRMEDCGQLTCQSIPLDFVEAGVPVTGDVVTSENCP